MARSRVLPQSTLASSWTLISLIAFAMLLVALPLSRASTTRAQELEGASAGDNTEVVAQGIAPFAGGEMAWRLVEDTAEPIGEAGFEERALGFAIATDGAVLLTDDPSGARTLLDEGEAAFTGEGAVQLRESLEDAATSYLRIGLVEASEAGNGNGGEVRFAGNGFDAPEGDYEVALTGVKLAAAESASVASEFEALVVVTAGEVTVGDGEVIAAGEATVVDGDVELQTADEAARVFVAAIGAEVPAAPVAPVEESTPVVEENAGTGRIIVLTELCPAGVTAEQAMDTSEGDPCFGGAAVEDMTVQVINTETDESFESDIDPANASAAFQGLPAGNYDVIFTTGEGLGETVGDCGGQDQSADLETVSISGGSVNLELPAEREYLCVTRTVQLGSEVSTDGGLSATFFACPEGMTFETLDPSQCEVITEGFDFGFQGDVDHPDLHLADATLGEGTFLWTGLELSSDANSGVSYSPIVYAFPSGYDAYGISTDGGDILLPHAGGYVLTEQHQSFNLAVYFFSS
jgi:hypothetical protein